MPDLCFTDAQEAACAKAAGWPAGPTTRSGVGSPENEVTGYWPGDLYLDTETGKLYVFNGTPGEDTGWVILN